MSNQPYLFWLGSYALLSQAELASVLPTVQWSSVNSQIISADSSAEIDPELLMNRLGGTIKILQQLLIVDTTESSNLEKIITDYLVDHTSGKLNFAISSQDRDHLSPIDAKSIKESLTKLGISSRFIESGEKGLSSAVWSHHRVKEIVCIHLPKTSQTLIAQTLACQNVDDWTLRDRGKPFVSSIKGLLPPKLARIMVNLAVGPKPADHSVLIDPFCGSGTVLMEALTVGLAHVLGGDVDTQVVTDAQRNLAWFTQAVPYRQKPGDFEIKLADATHLTTSRPVQYLVSEPFMGKTRFQPNQVTGIAKGLQKLYLGAFKNWTNFLVAGAKVVFIFPSFLLPSGQTIDTTDGLLDKLASLGYTLTSGKLDYSRPAAGVIRQIYQFVYQPKH